MKKLVFPIFMMFICLSTSGIMAQNMDCLGLKNPTNFTFTGGNASSKWEGFIGTKLGQASTCGNIAHSGVTVVAAANLTSQTGGSSCTSVNSLDYYGQSDAQRRFVIKGAGTDAATGNHLSYLPPDTSFHTSIRLGNFCGGTQAEQLSYEFNVNTNNMLVTIWYALSLQNGQHDNANNPEFVIVVEKKVGNNWVLAGHDTLCYIRPTPAGSGSDVTPFYVGSTGTHTGASYECNIYLPWNKVIVNLSKLQYQRVRIRIAAGDCGYSAHYACCYIAGDCQEMALHANGCAAGQTENVAGIKAPSGAVEYKWYRSRYGKLSGSDRTNINNYILLNGQTSDSLSVNIGHFVNNQTHDTVLQNTFMCLMKTKMNETLPIESAIYTDVGNTKPRLNVDSILSCNASITLRDLSATPFTTRDSDFVDTNLTQWRFYNNNADNPPAASMVDSLVGGTVTHTFPSAGNYSVRVRTFAIDTSCWNEKLIHVRVIKSPEPLLNVERNNLCTGDAITMFDATQGATYHEWTIGDTTYESTTMATQYTFDTTTLVKLRTHTNDHFMQDTNSDGQMDIVYCYSSDTVTINVQDYPELIVTGDTIVCNGTQAIVNVSSQTQGTTYDWFTSMNSTNPLQSNTSTLTTSPTHDIRYYVKARSPFGCEAWDSINIYIVDPQLSVPITEICDNTQIKLYASNAYSYTWSAMPFDPSLNGQEESDTIVVTPHQTTTYTLVGHGMNNCSATPLTQTVTVLPFPVPQIEMSPSFIDSEEPVVTLRDVSPGSTTSLWNFGGGATSTERQVRHTFTDLSEDSVLVSLTTGNELNCTSDTSFWIPIQLFSVWFPNALTPTLSTNRTFKIFTHNELEYYSLNIYNRQGLLVFHSTNPEEEWDCTYNGKTCPQGVYVYTCTFRRPGTTDIVTHHGTVMILQ